MSKNLKMPQTNYCIISGRIVRDPELKHLANDNAVCEVSIAHDSGYGERKKTSFIGVVCWGKTAEHVATLSKGAAVLVEGRIETDQWDDRESGAKRSKTKVNAHRVQSLEWPDEGTDTPGSYEPPRGQQPIPEDDIPF